MIFSGLKSTSNSIIHIQGSYSTVLSSQSLAPIFVYVFCWITYRELAQWSTEHPVRFFGRDCDAVSEPALAWARAQSRVCNSRFWQLYTTRGHSFYSVKCSELRTSLETRVPTHLFPLPTRCSSTPGESVITNTGLGTKTWQELTYCVLILTSLSTFLLLPTGQWYTQWRTGRACVSHTCPHVWREALCGTEGIPGISFSLPRLSVLQCLSQEVLFVSASWLLNRHYCHHPTKCCLPLMALLRGHLHYEACLDWDT